MKSLRIAAVLLAVVHWMAPWTVPAGPPAAMRPTVRDVALQPGGRLAGQVLNAQGLPVAGLQMTVVQDGQQLATLVSDADGHFAIAGLHGGMFQLATSKGVYVCRAWAPGTAPPVATGRLLVAAPDVVLRGQRPFGELIFADPIMVGLIVAGAIAIPIAVSNSKSTPAPES